MVSGYKYFWACNFFFLKSLVKIQRLKSNKNNMSFQLIKVKQIQTDELTTFVTDLITGNSAGIFYSSSTALTSGLQYQTINYGNVYSAIPKISFSINNPSGYAGILGTPISKGLSSAHFEFSNFIPSTGYSMDIITYL